MTEEGAGSPTRKKLKSGLSRMKSFVRFVNKTTRKVDVVWINFEGHGVKYKTLECEECVNVNTYVGHPWIFRDSLSGEKMLVQLKNVYNPEPWNNNVDGPPNRRVVMITIPMYTLKERSMQVVRSVFNRNSIKSLEIPKSLIEELLKNNQNDRSVDGVNG